VERTRETIQIANVFLVKQVPAKGPEQRESGKTVLYLLIIIIMLISYIIIKLLIKSRAIPAETRNRTPKANVYKIDYQ
jgi:hypothetical protein